MAVQFKVPRCWICCYMAQTPNITRVEILQTEKRHNLTTKNHRRPWFRKPIPVQPASPSPLLGIAPSRRWRDPKDCRRYPKVPQGYAVASLGWLGRLAKRPPNPTQTLGRAGLKPEAFRSPILGPRATKSRPSTRLPVFLSNFSVVLASGRRRRDLLPSRRRGELRSEDTLYCSAKGT